MWDVYLPYNGDGLSETLIFHGLLIIVLIQFFEFNSELSDSFSSKKLNLEIKKCRKRDSSMTANEGRLPKRISWKN